jgi:hypothetical protein
MPTAMNRASSTTTLEDNLRLPIPINCYLSERRDLVDEYLTGVMSAGVTDKVTVQASGDS